MSPTKMTSKLGGMSSTTLLFVVIVLAGFVLRMQSVFQTEVDHPIRGDAIDYFFYAYNLRHSGTYSRSTESYSQWNAAVRPDAFRTPGYLLFLAAFLDGDPRHVFPDGEPNSEIVRRVLVVQALLSTITLLGVFDLCRRVFPASLALLATALTALSPHLIVMNSYVLSETLFCSLVVLFACLLS